MKPRHLILATALAVTAVLAFLPGPDGGEDVVAPVDRRPRPASVAVPGVVTPQAPGPQGRPAFAAEARADLFPAQSFRPPLRAARVETPPPPPPMAPPLPYSFVGAWTEAGVETVFLGQGDRVLSVRAGAPLPGGWRLDRVAPESLQFTYEPLNQQRTLRIAP